MDTRIYSLDSHQLKQDLSQSVIRCVENTNRLVDHESSWKIQFLAAQLIVHVPQNINGNVLNSVIRFLDTLNSNIEKHTLSEFPHCPELFENIFKDLLTSTIQKITRRELFKLYHAVINPLSKFDTHPKFAHTALKKYVHATRQMEFFA